MVIRHLPVSRPPRTAFVLGGGGNLGAVQVGMLRAVIDRGYVPDVVVGCSVGALNSAIVAADPSPAGIRQLADIWLSIRNEDLLPTGRLSAVRLLTRRSMSMVPNDGLRQLIAGSLPFPRFEDWPIRLEVVATSLTSGGEKWFGRGPVEPAVLASSALPGVLPPVEIDGEMFIDGGVVNNVPISRALELGAERVVVFHVGNFQRPRPAPRRPLDVLLQSFSIARNHRFGADLARVPPDVEMIVLPGIDPSPLRYNDFGRSSQLIERGHAATAAYLDRLESAVSL
ncbi:MAG TPA: patatin-like phospholipase family protein [Acidimicrobiales bacterium]|nr:patatin-like phospholipase family protein [Acidimicrobiales bacterium]